MGKKAKSSDSNNTIVLTGMAALLVIFLGYGLLSIYRELVEGWLAISLGFTILEAWVVAIVIIIIIITIYQYWTKDGS